MDESLRFIEDQKIIAVIRTSDAADAEAIANALIDGGIKVLEFTSFIPQANKLIEQFSKRNGLLIGFGSATDGEQVHRAILSGAHFVSTLYTDRNILTVGKNNDLTVIQGASTATEAVEAYQLGADMIKIFPADLTGDVRLIRMLKRSFPFLKLVPSSGVTCENILDYVKAGAVACCLGQALCEKSLIRAHQWAEITASAKRVVEKIDSLKVAR